MKEHSKHPAVVEQKEYQERSISIILSGGYMAWSTYCSWKMNQELNSTPFNDDMNLDKFDMLFVSRYDLE